MKGHPFHHRVYMVWGECLRIEVRPQRAKTHMGPQSMSHANEIEVLELNRRERVDRDR